MFLLSVLLGSLAIAFVRGGSWRALAGRQWRISYVPLAALSLQVIAFLPTESASSAARAFAAALHVLSYLMLLVFVGANLNTPGMVMVGIGLAANTLVIVANAGFMPVSPEAAAGSAASSAATIEGVYNNSALLDRSSRLPFLADIFHTPAWLGVRQALSVGDVLIAVGAFMIVLSLTRRGSPPVITS